MKCDCMIAVQKEAAFLKNLLLTTCREYEEKYCLSGFSYSCRDFDFIDGGCEESLMRLAEELSAQIRQFEQQHGVEVCFSWLSCTVELFGEEHVDMTVSLPFAEEYKALFAGGEDG